MNPRKFPYWMFQGRKRQREEPEPEITKNYHIDRTRVKEGKEAAAT